MPDELDKAGAGLPTHLLVDADEVSTKEPPASLEDPQRSASPSSKELVSPPSHHVPSDASVYPVVPPFTLASERPKNQKGSIEVKNNVFLKRKRSLEPPPAASSKPINPGPAKTCRFQGVIEHRRQQEAMYFAMKMEASVLKTDRIHRHIFWTDGSIVYGACAAAAVAWKQPPSLKWMTEGFPYPYCIQSTDVVEMFAIAHALRRAVDEVRQARNRVMAGSHLPVTHEVFVFTDSIGALNNVKYDAWGYHIPEKCRQAHTIIDYSMELRNLGARLELHLVPGHSGVPGNTEAHRAAYIAAHRTAAEAGITSTEEGITLHQKKGHDAIISLTTPLLVPASPVPVRCSRGPQARLARKDRPLLSQPIRDTTPSKVVSTLSSGDVKSGEPSKTDDELSLSGPAPGPCFPPLNAGSTLSTGNPAEVSTALVTASALNSFHWFIPVNTRPTLGAADQFQSQSGGKQEPESKKQRTGTAANESHSFPATQPFSSGLIVSNPNSELPNNDNAGNCFKNGEFSFSPAKDMPVAVLKSSAASQSSVEPSNLVKTPGFVASPSPFHWFQSKDKGPFIFGRSVLSEFTPQHAEPAAKGGTLAVESPCFGSSTVATDAVTEQNSLSAPKFVTNTFHPLPPRPPDKPLLMQATLPPPLSAMPTSFKTSPPIVTTSKMLSFASPAEPRAGLSLASNSSFDEGKMKQSRYPSVGPSIREVPKTPAFFITTSKLRSFASPGEPQDGPTLAPILPPSDGARQRCGKEESSEDDGRPEDPAPKQ
ncbi:hypothetical protein PEBR_10304 [Penicillium brasilianum]|uniref:RNase H type-1 domain-containing protein n=1 Tax=Penicillium brasilianum TaxID=104259 RepID=A0A1S9RU21_PENBI|nr:hypothetical protein PEBR_10304 [Penicillium brasilianum]